MHPIRGGLNYSLELRWEGVPSLADALRMLKDQAARTPASQWGRVIGGWTEVQFARGTWPKEFGHRQGTVFSCIMSNYTPEGYPAGQGGSFTFRYVLSSANTFSPVQNSHFGWGAMTPLEIDEIRPNDKAHFLRRGLSGKEGSFVSIDQPGVNLVTW